MQDPAGNSDDRGESANVDSNGNRTPPSEPAPSPPPVPPDALKPWYYQGWFIVPTFVWWPCSAILFIRSPWHNSVLSGALSWAWIIIGGGWIFLRTQYRWQNGESLMDPTLLALVAPGIALTVITQSLWLARDRPRIRRIRDAGGFAAYETGKAAGLTSNEGRSANEDSPRRSSRGGGRRRRRRR